MCDTSGIIWTFDVFDIMRAFFMYYFLPAEPPVDTDSLFMFGEPL
jgi:hypothetical protein